MARLVSSITLSTGNGLHQAAVSSTSSNTADVVVDINLATVTTLALLDAAYKKARQSLREQGMT